ncbi:uncharacterized protein [Haliotis asinina]|uniref:uncharacterized protein n=1 Tax=Haliotis asinina TaxID=109174 RepID=UPI0035322E29
MKLRIFGEMDVPPIAMLFVWIYSLNQCGHCMLQLSSYPALASLGMSFTMSCSNNDSGGRARSWYRDGDIILRTRYVSLTQCVTDVVNDNLYRTLSGRLTVNCSINLYTLSLLVTASDNGSAWWCRDEVTARTSNTLKIFVKETSVTSTSPPPTTTTTPTSPQSTRDGGVHIGAGVGGGVVVVIVVVVSVLCLRRKGDRHVHNGSSGDDTTHLGSSTSYANLGMKGGQETNKIILVDNDIYERSSDTTPFHQPLVNVPVTTVDNDIYERSSDTTPFHQPLVNAPVTTVDNDIYERSSDATPFHQPPVNVPVTTGCIVNVNTIDCVFSSVFVASILQSYIDSFKWTMEHIRILILLCGCIPRTQGSIQLVAYVTGSTYTMVCSTITASQTIDWFRNDQLVIRTRALSTTRCRLEHEPSAYDTYLSGQVNVSCDFSQHNVSLRTAPPINRFSVWQCENTGRERSNRITIETSSTEAPRTRTRAGSIFSTASPGTPETSTASTTMLMTNPETSTMAVYVAVGAGVGVVIIVVFVVIVVCVRRRKGPYSRAASERDMATDFLAPAPIDSNVGEGLKDKERVLVENDLYEGSADITTSRQLTESDHAVTDVYTEVQKPKKARKAQTDEAEYVNMNEL